MKIKYTGKGTAITTMKQYLDEVLMESFLNINKTAATPARKNLFEIDTNSPRLNKQRAETLHSVVAKLLYVSLRARVDLLLPVIFLCTRVSVSTEQDEATLRRLLEYTYGSLDDEYILGADDTGRMRSWVDASFAVHPGMKSHTGGVISFGRGGLVCKSMKHKSVELSSWVQATIYQHVVGETISGGTRPPRSGEFFRTGQRECHSNGDQRPDVSWREVVPHKHQVFLD
jgi:hypothetical protein